MSNYQLGKIYKIQHREKADLFYIGSTAMTLQERLRNHKKKKKKTKKQIIYKIIEEEGWENFDMILIKDFTCNSKRELEMEEQRCIDAFNPTLNTQRAYRTEEYTREYYKNKKKEYYELNKEELRKKQEIIMTCECGREIKKGHIARHRKTKIHIDLMKKPL
jgi:protease II